MNPPPHNRHHRGPEALLGVTAVLLIAVVAPSCGRRPPPQVSSPVTPTTSTTPATGPAAAGPTAPSAKSVPAAASPDAAPDAPGRRTITVDVHGTPRTAVLVVPAGTTRPAPLLIAFHGHGGSGAALERKMDFERLWPEAIVVYPDGVTGRPGRTDPQGRVPGWQTRPGEADDADLAFYDALLTDLVSRAPVDPDRIYLMGHSNGSGFVSLLLNVRGAQVAATANSSGQPGPYLRTDPARSMFMSMGRNDLVVPYANQVRSVPLAEHKIGADPSTARVDGHLRTEQGRGGLELAVYDHPGGHEPPAELPPLVVAFFQRHRLSTG